MYSRYTGSYTVDRIRREVNIYDDAGAAAIREQYATGKEIAAILLVSRATGYRLMHRGPVYTIKDHRTGHEYIALPLEEVAHLHRAPRGNPNFYDAAYQRNLARRKRRRG